MSRHVFENGAIRTVVGWDPPMQTFYVQHGPILPNGEWLSDEPKLWIGTAWQELHSIGQLVSLNDDYQLGLSKDIIEVIELDQILNI